MLNPQQTASYERDGYLIVRNLFKPQEVELGEKIARCDNNLRKAGVMRDATGAESKLWLATDLKEDIYNAFARSPRIVDATEQLLLGPVYLWHYKMMMKDPKVGGAWEWHQDYGYWYNDGCLSPDLISCMIAINRATRENGCLQVLRASHKLGRMNHGGVGGQTGADSERVEAAMKFLDLVYVELEPGDALFFHSNLLHCSAQNRSDYPRWALVTCYNSMGNIPYKGGHGKPVRLEPWDDGAIMTIGQKQLARMNEALNSVTV